ncbi:zinc finger protein 729-like isoform X2 [Paramacrobiotus metropolitanus]|nr:zinc finger protein 729-like isoform X2 [Paramacrobiotus metropolitanus]XP_055334097.1 zinc finger protein 729-like isoform X2 [Paramacrobiotus metropolitanus]
MSLALSVTTEDSVEIAPPSPQRCAPDDVLMYCDCCHKFLPTPCWLHAASVCDEPVIPLSVGSLPKMLYLDVCDDSLTGKAVFAKEVIVRHTVFGPLIAPLMPGNSEKALYICITEEHRKYYELESDYACNWMKHVRFADNLQNSNLLVFSRGSQVVFVTIKTVSPHEELKVWYSKQYLDMVDTPVNAAVVDFQLKMEDEVKGTFLPSDDYAEVADAVPRNSKVTGSSPVEAVCVSHLPMESGSSLPVTVDADYRQTDEGFRVRSKPRRTRKTENFYTSNICSECNMRFRKEDMLRLHQFSHTGYDEQPERECPECSKHFDGFPALLKHVDEHGTPLVQCPVCNDTCSLGVILVHLRRYHPGVERGKLYEKRLNCDKCGMRFSYNFLYRLHQLGHQDKECVDSIKISRKCPECGDMFENLEELAEHVDVHGKLMKKCPVCNGYYPGMEKHIARDHPQYLAETRCPECGKECANESSLLHHLQGHQMRASLDSLTCDECRLQFAKDSLYVLHKSSHETPACHAISGAQKCPECDEECDGMGALLEHVVKHAVAAQKCPECYHWFPRHRLRFHIKRHKSAHHSVLQEKESVKRPNLAALTCADCGLRFSTVELVHLHKNKHLEDKISVSTRQCPECSRSFAVADDLVKHVEEHATITRKCPVCGVWRAQMSQHLAQKHPGYKDETQYKCPQCNQRFRLRRRLEEHMLRHGQQGRFRKTTCTQCGLRFSTKLLCRIHEYEHGDKELSDDLPNQTTCAECAEELEGFDALVKHVRIHGRQTEECPVCMGRFHALNEHIRYHHPGCQYRVRKNYTFSTEDNSYRCGECGKEFKSGVGLTAHVNSHVTKALLTARTCSDCGLRFKTDIGCRLHTVRHGNVELTETMRDTRRCPECRRNFERLEELLDHISNHGRSTEKCPVCGDWYAALTVHIRRDHPDFLPKNAITPRKSTSDGLNADDAIDDVCKCPDCGKEFNSRTSFNKHVVNHRTTDKLKTLTCSECGLRFTSDVLCRLHEVCHGKVEVSEAARATRDCPECDKVFAELNELVEHVALHGRHTDKCPVCGQWYASLKEHIRRDHNEHFAEFVAQEKLNCATSKSKERGGYRCGKCGKELPTRNSYDLHMKSHRLKEMKYGHLTCSDCGLRFGSESLCNLHRMQHADKDNLTDRQVDVDDCPQCGESFQEVKELVEHVALHGRRTDKCPVCGQWYAALKEHIRRDHNEHYTEFVAQEKSTSDTPKTKKHGEYRCEKCGKLLPTRTSYDFHTKAHRSNEVTYNSVTCNDCGLRFRSGLLCQLHKLQHASDGCSNEELKNTKSCPECEEEFQGVALLGAHVAVHGKATSKCPVCSRWYGALRFHVRREHPEHFLKYTAQLNANRVQVPAKAVSDESKRKETPRKGYRCPKCSKSIENFSAFTCHMQQSHGVEEPAGIGTCDMCGLRFLSEQLCELHKVQHGLFSKNLQCTGKCPECGGKFQQLQALAEHVATHGVQTEKCYVCNKWFASLRQHAPRCFNRAVVHDRSEFSPLVDSLAKASSPRKTGHRKRYFKCQECIKEFRSRDFLQAHMKADHAAPKCVVCDEVLGSVDDRHQHMLTHSTTNDLKCGICKKTFQSSRSFAAHVKKHANGKLCEPIAEEFAPDECVVCRKSFADFLQLNQHVKKHNLHGGFECAMCAERFPFYYLLSRHVMEKQHWRPKIGIPCSVCHEELPNENALQLHLFTHHDAELTVKCCWCAERFTCNDDLDVHIAAVHAPADGEDYGMEEVAVDDELFGNVGGN